MITIPSIGSCLKLTQDWSFDLRAEKRNQKFWEKVFGLPEEDPVLADKYDLWDRDAERGITRKYDSNSCYMKRYRFWRPALLKNAPEVKQEITFPAGTILKINRIYIRQGQGNYNSITFTIVDCPRRWKGRFWAKLEEVNRIEADWDEKTIERKV